MGVLLVTFLIWNSYESIRPNNGKVILLRLLSRLLNRRISYVGFYHSEWERRNLQRYFFSDPMKEHIMKYLFKKKG